MFRGENEVSATRRLRYLRPFAGKAGHRLKLRQCGGGVGVRVRLDPLLDPFHAAVGAYGLAVPGSGQTGIKPPMHEHAEPRLAPPAHAGIALRGRFRDRGFGGFDRFSGQSCRRRQGEDE